MLVDSKKVTASADGSISLNDDCASLYTFIVMPRYGANLHKLFAARKGKLSSESIYSLGIQLLNIMEQIHSKGYVFNDLKLDNLLFDFETSFDDEMKTTEEDLFRENNVNIIDFGFACPYKMLDGSEEHLPKMRMDLFQGNILFSSINQLSFHSTSRRDDLISLFYLMVYLFKKGQLPGVKVTSDMDVNEEFRLIRDVKKSQKTSDVCFGNTKDLSSFKREIFSYRFMDTPDYEKLRVMLAFLRDIAQTKRMAQKTKNMLDDTKVSNTSADESSRNISGDLSDESKSSQ